MPVKPAPREPRYAIARISEEEYSRGFHSIAYMGLVHRLYELPADVELMESHVEFNTGDMHFKLWSKEFPLVPSGLRIAHLSRRGTPHWYQQERRPGFITLTTTAEISRYPD